MLISRCTHFLEGPLLLSFRMEKTEDELEWERDHEVIIEMVNERDSAEVKDFLYEHLYKDEPLMRSLEILELQGCPDRAILKETDQFMITQPIGSSSTHLK